MERDLLALRRQTLRLVIGILTGHVSVQKHFEFAVTLNNASDSRTKALSTLSQKSATVAEFRRCLAVFGDSLTFLRQSHFSATVSLKPCPQCCRKVRLWHKNETVAQK